MISFILRLIWLIQMKDVGSTQIFVFQNVMERFTIWTNSILGHLESIIDKLIICKVSYDVIKVIISTFFNDRDPQGRILLETAYVSILDAGINPQVVRGKKVGVGSKPFKVESLSYLKLLGVYRVNL